MKYLILILFIGCGDESAKLPEKLETKCLIEKRTTQTIHVHCADLPVKLDSI